jgi:hypothetical protein
MLCAASLLLTQGGAASAQDTDAQVAADDLVIEELVENLADEGLEVEDLELAPGELEIETEAIAPSSDFVGDLHLVGDATGSFEVSDVVDGTPITATYSIEVLQLDESGVKVRVTDPVTGQTMIATDSDVTTSVPAVIGIGAVGASVATILGWLAVGTAVVIGVVLFVKATVNVVSRVKAEIDKRKSERPYVQAYIINDFVYFGKAMTSKEAVRYGKAYNAKTARNNVYTPNNSVAKALCKSIGNGAAPKGAENHYDLRSSKKGIWFDHWHPKGGGMHCMFGTPIVRT